MLKRTDLLRILCVRHDESDASLVGQFLQAGWHAVLSITLEPSVETLIDVESHRWPCVMTELNLPERRVTVLELLLPEVSSLGGHLVDADDDWRGLGQLLRSARWARTRLDLELVGARDFRRGTTVRLHFTVCGSLGRAGGADVEAHHGHNEHLPVRGRALGGGSLDQKRLRKSVHNRRHGWRDGV